MSLTPEQQQLQLEMMLVQQTQQYLLTQEEMLLMQQDQHDFNVAYNQFLAGGSDLQHGYGGYSSYGGYKPFQAPPGQMPIAPLRIEPTLCPPSIASGGTMEMMAECQELEQNRAFSEASSLAHSAVQRLLEEQLLLLALHFLY